MRLAVPFGSAFFRLLRQNGGDNAPNLTLDRGFACFLLPRQVQSAQKNGWMHIHMSTSKQLLIVDDDQEIRELL
ncbi:MAG: hypothetical protein WBF70_18800, partial [Aeromonas molluscorum]